MPRVEERNHLVFKTHQKLNHRGVKGTHYQLKKSYYWPGMKNQVTKILNECETCQVANRNNRGGVKFVTTSHKGEKIGIDIMEIGEPRKHVLIGIDYFTRYVYATVLKDKSTKNVLASIQDWFKGGDIPEEIISDNAKEFSSSEFKEWCSVNEINHRSVSIESHGSNGRIERVIRTIRESVFKQGRRIIEEAVTDAVKTYNETYHSELKCTPKEAVIESNRGVEVKWENSKDGYYASKFVKRARETFEKGQEVRIAKRENLGENSKRDSGRFTRSGTVIEKCGGDSYLVRTEDGRI